jgi:thioredoxin-dependent peroxiredoxin
VIAISVDKPEKNMAFAQSVGVAFPVLSDPQRIVSRSYGVLIPVLRLARRVALVINKDGIIESIHHGEEAITYQPSAVSRQ